MAVLEQSDEVRALLYGVTVANAKADELGWTHHASVTDIRSVPAKEKDFSIDIEMDIHFAKESLYSHLEDYPELPTLFPVQRLFAGQVVMDSVAWLLEEKQDNALSSVETCYYSVGIVANPMEAYSTTQADPKDTYSWTFTVSFHWEDTDLPQICENVSSAADNRATVISAFVSHDGTRLNLIFQIHPQNQGPPSMAHTYISVPHLSHSTIYDGVRENISSWTGKSTSEVKSVKSRGPFETNFKPHSKSSDSTGSRLFVGCVVDVQPGKGVQGA